jgi:3-hydroxy-3-methylglutaryl CoA synthase
MKLTIEKTDNTNAWYQLFLHTETMKIEMGSACYGYEDCLTEANEIILEFSKEKVLLVSNEIYDLHP